MATSGRTSSNDNTIAPSNLRRQNTLSKAARILRSASRRVVNNPLEHSTQSEPHHEPEPELQPDHQPLSDQLNQNQCFQLRGKTLNLFGPDHPVRRFLFVLFRSGWIDPLIFLLIIINLSILTFQSLPSVYDHPRRENSYFQGWDDYLLLAIFVIFTIESVSRIIVSGFIFNPTTSSSPQDDYPREVETKTNWKISNYPSPQLTSTNTNNFHYHHQDSSNVASNKTNESLLYSYYPPSVPFQSGLQKQKRSLINQTAYLRQSWNRLDLIAIISFWIDFALFFIKTRDGTILREKYQIYVFKSLSCLRVMRLLTVTSGTTTILNSLKIASPLLVNVLYFIFFSVALFSIVGVQSFKGSYDRHCVWLGKRQTDSNNNLINLSNYTFTEQTCGGQYNSKTGLAEGFIQSSTGKSFKNFKGYLCPQGQMCLETGNPNNGTQNFDNMAGAVLQVAIIASANSWSNMMYSLMDSEYFASCFFFIVCVLIMNFWLLNILVAVITNTFGEIASETKSSAFSNEEGYRFGWQEGLDKVNQRYLRYFWLLVVLVDFGFQASRNSSNVPWKDKLDHIQLGFTFAFAFEILLRLSIYIPDRLKNFIYQNLNIIDSLICVICLIIQLPVIKVKNPKLFVWLCFFQIARFYRIIVFFPRIGKLIRKLRGSFIGLMNMILFLLSMNFFAALIGSQLLRGVIPKADGVEMTFYSLWNSFLAMYQVFSSENWTTVLYSAMSAQAANKQEFISGILITCWFLFANFVLLQMFIAVISEGFEVAEEQKRKEQVRMLVDRVSLNNSSTRLKLFSRLNPYHLLDLRRSKKILKALGGFQSIPSSSSNNLPNTYNHHYQSNYNMITLRESYQRSFITRARKAFLLDPINDSFGDSKLSDKKFTNEEKLKVFLEMTPSERQQYYLDEYNEQLTRESEFIKAHPTYDKVFWIISQQNPIRKLCQILVEPAYGERLYGRKPNKIGVQIFKLIVFHAILGGVIVAAIATPVYIQNYYLTHGLSLSAWFTTTEMTLGFIFVLEFVIKVLADGFIFTPNAYLLNTWNRIDFFVLITLMIDITTSLVRSGTTNRALRSLKAFRALRLINLTKSIRETFFNVLILGFGDLLDASVLTVMYIVPFAVWGQTLFEDLLLSCNDSGDGIVTKWDCMGEYVGGPRGLDGIPDKFKFMMPRTWSNPEYSFDLFKSSLLILFEIISLEGWIDVMSSLMAITGKGLQPKQDASQGNAIFSLVYNLFGATVILSLFLSVIINNFLKRSGSAFLTTEQQQWINLRKLIMRQSPSKRPRSRPKDWIRNWCYTRAIHKYGFWSKMMTGLYTFHVALLLTLARSNMNSEFNFYRDFIFLGLSMVYLIDIMIKLLGLGFRSFYQNGWNIFDVITVLGTISTTVSIVKNHQDLSSNINQNILNSSNNSNNNVMIQFQKVFLVGIGFKLVLKINRLNRLFKVAISSLISIANLFGLWAIFFLVFGIMFVENFSLTRIGPSSISRNSNYQSLANSLVMLAIQSTGEGWNNFMHDYTVEAPYCIDSPNYLFNDCGSEVASYILFISWNVLSMYIILNMFTGLVVDNFAFVFQSVGKVRSIDRDEIRKFKVAWSEVDLEKTGYLREDQLCKFFSKLRGAFEVNVYPEELKVREMIRSCFKSAAEASYSFREGDRKSRKSWTGGYLREDERPGSYEVLDIVELNRRLKSVDWNEIQKRKRLYEELYQEAKMIEGKRLIGGISFNEMMLLVAHYKLINDDQAMRLEEYLDRKEQKQKVEDSIKFEKIEGVFKVFIDRNRFLRHLKTQKTVVY
ncbi:Ion transport protein-domain-containing protein [Phakopsora pachyrhizi]|uniref:Calcium-channel protein CCH1 n=1 Tax=Phakopsora pachyrhizi TaxID=170000 RepID=A0AAV0BCP1_PHAPC|nr:Ion transport protein-domain-containing protein [Phakopsora pachyrhizi]CAH7684043.1 Ion transport protein-domain-containing protein [Phakopsora pachyrhizi]